MSKHKSFADLIRRSGSAPQSAPALPASYQKIKEDWERTKASQEWRAMEKLEAALRALKNDPEISASEPCKDVLELVIDLLDRAWPNQDLQTIVSPMQKHFDGVKAAEASRKKKEIQQGARELHYRFLDQQNDISDTARLAGRLRKHFSLESERGSKDVVRAWKTLRASGKA